MTYREIMVHVDSLERSETRVRLALDLAKRFGARLRGVFAECDPYLANLASRRPHEIFRDEENRWRALWAGQTSASGIDAEWSANIVRRDDALISALLFWARHSDLAVLGQHDARQQHASGVPQDLIERIVLWSGRPVLALPYAGEFPHVGRRVMVAWNGGREATRAVHDALPFLVTAEEVVLVALNPGDPARPHGDVPCADLARHLKAHGVAADTEALEVQDIGVMDMLLSRIADRGADLLVMGAHGHYGFPHLHRGSGTRHILTHLTVPVLLSH